ncbi:MAG: GNAT family N-acetyltransferase [Eubacteriales bacterium]|nr:GNAT family N-acetyltransferase [Eubacteriales bacterium]
MTRSNEEWLQSAGASPETLMRWHAEAMFTRDAAGRLLRVNEPWPGASEAAKLFITRPIAGPARCYVRHDVPGALAARLKTVAESEPAPACLDEAPRCLTECLRLLNAEQAEYGPCYWVPPLPTAGETVVLTRESARQLAQPPLDWLADELPYAQPCAAVIRDGRVASVCRSVRIGDRVAEAGLETLEACRGQGCAALAVAAWAQAVREQGLTPLYSTSWDNLASQRVVQKLGLWWYGVNGSVLSGGKAGPQG